MAKKKTTRKARKATPAKRTAKGPKVSPAATKKKPAKKRKVAKAARKPKERKKMTDVALLRTTNY